MKPPDHIFASKTMHQTPVNIEPVSTTLEYLESGAKKPVTYMLAPPGGHAWETSDYAAMSVRAAAAAEAGTGLEIDPSDPCFFNPDDMVAAIADHCARTGREMPQGIGALALAIYRGMAAEIAATLTRLEQEIGSSIPALRVCGGGGQDAGFCAFLAEVLQRQVVVGPVEASSWGNAMLQLVGLGAIPSVREGRALIARSTECRTFLPA